MYNMDSVNLVLQPSPPNPLYRVGLSFNLTLDLLPQTELSKKLSSLDQDVIISRFQLQRHPQGDENRALSLNILANTLFARFELSGMIPDLDDAIRHHREASDLTKSREEQSASLNNLAHCLYTRFKRLGLLPNLREAIELHRKALSLRQPGHRYRPTTLNNLALCLSSLFDQQGVEQDLDDAIELLNEAVDLLRLDDDPNLLFVLLNLGDCLYARFKSTRNLASLSEAIHLQQRSLPGKDDHAYPYASSSLARSLFSRFKELQEVADLRMAIDLEKDAIRRCLNGHSIRPQSLHNLGECLLSQFKLTEALLDLDEAIKCHREALELRPLHHPDRSSSLSSLAKCLLIRSKRSKRSERTDRHEAFSLYSKLTEISQDVQSVFLQDLYAARDWVSAAEETNHRTMISAYQTLFKLLVNHLTTLPSLTQHYVLLKKITSSLALDAFSACLRQDSPVDAVELLEQGRAVFWGLLLRLRSPLDEVITFGERGQQLAEKFKELASYLRHTSRHDRAWDLNTRLQDVVSNIRGLPGLARFLLPPYFPDLQQAAIGGPVIIVNASRYSCDGLIVLPDQDPIHVPLQINKAQVQYLSLQVRSILAMESRAARTMDIFSSISAVESLTKMLRELWTKVVSPIVNVLEDIVPHQSRVWWCPTSDFTLLPLHAAGPYENGKPNLFDLYISSYTLTLTTLVRARQNNPPDAMDFSQFLVVAVGHTPEAAEIPGVYSELERITTQISPCMPLMRLKDEDATVGRVIEELKRSQFVHFACHAWPKRSSPFHSALLLGDGRLEIENIMQHEMGHARFAYLSACETTVGDKESPDEAIHLAGVMQFTGFQSVIGTIWAVSDQGAQKVAEKFYDNMLDGSRHLHHTRAAHALHESLKNADIPLGQRVLYIHLGA